MVQKTGNFKQAKDWRGSLDDFLEVGDTVCEEIKNHFINVLPPVRVQSNLIQMGEPHFHVMGEEIFPTIVKIDGEWIYAGNCFAGESANILMEDEMSKLKDGDVTILVETSPCSYREYKGRYDSRKEVLFFAIPENYEIIGYKQE